MSTHSTLIKPPKSLPHHSPIENVLSLLPLVDIGPDIYTNARPLWHPPGARGIYGGAAIAQCLSAAQATIPKDFTVHSMHCYFVLAGNSEIPILYHVERVRDGKSFITRTVQARQRGKCIFTTTLSFMKEDSGGKQTVQHASKMPADIPEPPALDPNQDFWSFKASGSIDDRPFESVRVPGTRHTEPSERKLRQWLRARGRISDCPPEVREQEITDGERANKPGDNHQAHLSALAYMSDSYFIGTVARVHNLIRFASRKNIENTLRNFKGPEEERAQMERYLENIARDEEEENKEFGRPPESDGRRIGMMVSLDHTIYFHNPRAFRADEWMLTEMESPWAGDGRGVVLQRIWTKGGTLIATCVQEGCVRLQQQKESKI
ncbi:palmitoyl-CoA hydrolase [Exophiala aquamarina CBS 119918]|uniref:Palmitoyl-CoA hydrolase n=1 Tax=Exophiala aquamarina CBS 119918 TaxID=1182545 RepID=A0A072NZJ7_9EURO|nr:palmitoyl-CoA hydrolase [Exophiala aquamarina CBS 119918]KEF53264.1 palmitoyl-CoA hydrolase [Exophiala aquamarina CBS 119918]